MILNNPAAAHSDGYNPSESFTGYKEFGKIERHERNPGVGGLSAPCYQKQASRYLGLPKNRKLFLIQIFEHIPQYSF